jgi:L-2-amino-thiazoline-4-carboxylic acid hydrolase
MNNLNKSLLSFIKKDCIVEFGNEKGMKIYIDTSVMLTELLENADFRNSKAVEKHMRYCILPEIAFYRAMQKNGIEKEKAYLFLYKELQKPAIKSSRIIGMFKTIPFFFLIAKWILKKSMAYYFPKEGWQTEWKTDNKKELAMDIHRCLYLETFIAYNCPEICKATCDTDITTYGCLAPKVIFVRTKTLAEGGDCCDFRFLNGTKETI